MIQSMRCIFLRTSVRALNSKGIKLHEIAITAMISVPDLQRLMEFGSMLDREMADRLIAFSRAELLALGRRLGSAHASAIPSWRGQATNGPGSNQRGQLSRPTSSNFRQGA